MFWSARGSCGSIGFSSLCGHSFHSYIILSPRKCNCGFSFVVGYGLGQSEQHISGGRGFPPAIWPCSRRVRNLPLFDVGMSSLNTTLYQKPERAGHALDPRGRSDRYSSIYYRFDTGQSSQNARGSQGTSDTLWMALAQILHSFPYLSLVIQI